VRRSSGLGWRRRLGTFDWIVLALPGTPQTRGLIGAAEFTAMKADAVLINFARADIVDEAALIEALREKRIAAAVLDVTEPEPLPPAHPLWQLDNAHLTMHLSGIPTPASLRRAAERFARNCGRFRNGEPLEAQVDLELGY
jgi:phosphoglycerate dehydrogenase-like enzyme